MFTDDAHIDYSSAGAIAGSREQVADWLAQGFAAIPMSMHYITNIESQIDGETAQVRAMFYNPMQLPGMTEPAVAAATTTTNWSASTTAGVVTRCGKTTSGSSTRPAPDRCAPRTRSG